MYVQGDRMIKHFCDRCGRELKKKETYFIEVTFSGKNIEWHDMELCKECFKELKKLIEGILK